MQELILVVKPQQRRGVGRALVGACIERARSEGRERIVLFTAPPMTAAQRFYEAIGFRRAPERDWSLGPDLTLKGYVFDI